VSREGLWVRWAVVPTGIKPQFKVNYFSSMVWASLMKPYAVGTMVIPSLHMRTQTKKENNFSILSIP
jgi:hypothetical protein